MKIQELIGTLLAGSTRLGTYTLPELIQYVQSKNINGIAVAVSGDRKFELAILDGEPGRPDERLVEAQGFKFDRQKGSHAILRRETADGARGCVVPMHREIQPGT